MRKHPTRCAMANPKSKCRCRCGGAKHGSGRPTIGKEDMYERTVTNRLGGEVARIIDTAPENLICCGKTIPMNFLAYPHEGGVPDSTGKKWWLFVECPYCGKQISWKHFRRVRSLF